MSDYALLIKCCDSLQKSQHLFCIVEILSRVQTAEVLRLQKQFLETWFMFTQVCSNTDR